MSVFCSRFFYGECIRHQIVKIRDHIRIPPLIVEKMVSKRSLISANDSPSYDSLNRLTKEKTKFSLELMFSDNLNQISFNNEHYDMMSLSGFSGKVYWCCPLGNVLKSNLKYHFNPFAPNALFPYPPENICKVFWCFQGVEKGCIGNKWVNIEYYFMISWMRL